MHLTRRRNVIDEQKLAVTVTLHNEALSERYMARGTVDNLETNNDGKLLQPSVSLRLVSNLHEYERSRWLLIVSSKSGRKICTIKSKS
jgi:hypothetical protein